MNTSTLLIPNMNCKHCVAKIQTALENLPELEDFEIVPDEKSVQLTYINPMSLANAQQALQAIGYPAQLQSS